MTKFMKNSACCEDTVGIEDIESNDCLGKWKNQLINVSNDFTTSNARTEKSREEYVNSLGWKTKLEGWKTIIDITDGKAQVIVKELGFFIEQTKMVCENSKSSTEGLEKLSYLLKSFFDSFFTYEEEKKGLKDLIVEFKKTVEGLTTIGDEDKAEVLKCITNYEEKIVVVCSMQDAILTHLVEVLKQAHLLSEAICGENGLQVKLESLKNVFEGNPDDNDEHCPDDHPNSGAITTQLVAVKGYDNDDYPCNHQKATMTSYFPIHTSKYYKGIDSCYETAVSKTTELESSWIMNKKYSDKILSHKLSLTEAIKVAEAAESAK